MKLNPRIGLSWTGLRVSDVVCLQERSRIRFKLVNESRFPHQALVELGVLRYWYNTKCLGHLVAPVAGQWWPSLLWLVTAP